MQIGRNTFSDADDITDINHI